MFCLGHLFIGGLGMYFLVRRWTGNGLAAAVAGAVFGFNGLSWQSLMWLSNDASLAWMPWVVLTLESAWREGGRKIFWAALAGAMQMLAGAPEIIVFTWLIAGTLLLAEAVNHGALRTRMFARFFLVICLVTGLAAAQLLPFLDLLGSSQRGNGFADSAWSMPWTGWLNYLAPLFHTFSNLPKDGVYSQYGQFWTSSYYLGAGTVVLAALAPFCIRTRRAWLLAGLTILSLVIALGDQGGVYTWLRKGLPFLGFMRYPIKFVVVATFTVPILAATWLAWFLALPEKQWPAERNKLWRFGGVAAAIMVGAIVSEWVWPAVKDAPVTMLINTIVRAVFLGLILFCIGGLRSTTEANMQRLLRICLILFFWFDIFTHNPKLNPTVDRNVFEPDTVREFFKWGEDELKPGTSRAMKSAAAANWLTIHSVPDPVAEVNGKRLAMFGDFNVLDHAAKIDGMYSVELREISRLNQQIYGAAHEPSKLKDFLGVARFSNSTNFVDWVARTNFMPFITGGQEPVVAGEAAAMQAVLGAEFEPAQVVYLEPAAQSKVSAHRATVKISSTSFAPQAVGAEVEASAPAMVVVAQAFYHCWHAYVDGKRVPLWRST